MTPTVTVLMPVYNAAAHLRQAVDSVLAQTMTEFELLAIDDGSADYSGALLASYSDPRIRVVSHTENLGLVATLNEGLGLAQGVYVARMDADDVCRPNRLAKQAKFLDIHPEIGMVGTWARRFGSDSRLIDPPTDPATIRCELLFRSAFAHPTVMLRAEEFRKHRLEYRSYSHAEDRDLWQRAAECFPLANLAEALLDYRVHAESVTGKPANEAARSEALRRIELEAIRRLDIEPTEDELAIHRKLGHGIPQELGPVEAWLTRLKDANRVVNFYPIVEFERVVARRWYSACNVAAGWGVAKWPRMRSSRLSDSLTMSPVEVMKFLPRLRR